MRRLGILLPGCGLCIAQSTIWLRRRGSSLRVRRPALRALGWLVLCLSGILPPVFAQQMSVVGDELPNSPGTSAAVQQLPGSVSGFVTDGDGDSVPGAKVTLSLPSKPASDDRQVIAGGDGRFSFMNVPAGSYWLTVSAPGFATQQTSGVLHGGEQVEISRLALPAAATIDVDVVASQRDIAEAQIRDEEKQRVFGVIPNFYVSYVANPAPLVAKQKFELAWKQSVDPVNFAITGIIAGAQQSAGTFGGYGRGADGYAKHYGAAYADGVIGTMLSNAILPSLFRQDPRYYYKGTGSTGARALYAIANTVICKGDNGRWQTNYSNILGNLAAGGISNLYYPSGDRDGTELTLENGLIGIAAGAGANLFQEFVLRRISTHVHPPVANP
jgi:hypothetical protein